MKHLYIEPKKRAACERMRNIFGTDEKKKHWKRQLRKAWHSGIYPKTLNDEEKKALQELKATIGNSGLAKL